MMMPRTIGYQEKNAKQTHRADQERVPGEVVSELALDRSAAPADLAGTGCRLPDRSIGR